MQHKLIQECLFQAKPSRKYYTQGSVRKTSTSAQITVEKEQRLNLESGKDYKTRTKSASRKASNSVRLVTNEKRERERERERERDGVVEGFMEGFKR